MRARDYTPTKVAGQVQTGGADQFLDFMKGELFPFIESNYKADGANRSLMGCSLGGLFTLYAMFTHNDMFSGYAAASPAISWDNGVLTTFEKSFYSKSSKKPLRLYMTVGDVEGGRGFYENFADTLLGRHYPNVSMISKVLENTGHSGTKSETYSRGLQYIFQRNDLQLSAAELDKLIGSYQTENGMKVKIIKEDQHLALEYGPKQSLALMANTAQHFYINNQFFNIHFAESKGKSESFELMRYGSNMTFKRLKE